MTSYQPEDWPALFEQRLNAGDVDATVAIYEPAVAFVQQSGEVLIGREQIHRVISDLVAKQTRLRGQVIKAIAVGNIALLYTNWDGTGIDPSGKAFEYHHRAVEVVRRQRDGTWMLIVGDPNGRG